MARKLGETDNSELAGSDGDGSTSPDGSDRTERSLSRRTYIERGIVAVAAMPATGTGTRRAVERHGIEFEGAVDAVEDLGLDPTGKEAVDGAFADVGDALVQFPDGTYRFDTDGVAVRDRRLGLEGTGEDTTFVTSRNHRGPVLDGAELEAAYFGDIDIDHANPNAYAAIRFGGTRVVIRNVVLGGPEPDSPGRDRLTIMGGESPTTYEVTTRGRIRAVEPRSRTYGVSKTNAEGLVTSGSDTYAVDGTITDLRLTGPADVYVNGERVAPEEFGACVHMLAFASAEERTNYAFSVSSLSPDQSAIGEAARGNRIRDRPDRDTDIYRFGGRLDSLRANGPTTLLVGGRKTDPNAAARMFGDASDPY